MAVIMDQLKAVLSLRAAMYSQKTMLKLKDSYAPAVWKLSHLLMIYRPIMKHLIWSLEPITYVQFAELASTQHLNLKVTFLKIIQLQLVQNMMTWTALRKN